MNRVKATASVASGARDIAPVSGTPQYFTNGNPATPTPATVLPGYFLNMVQDELMAVILAAGLTPDDTNWAQLLQAIQKIGSPVVGSANGLVGAAAGGTALASWTVKELAVATALGGVVYKGVNLGLNFNGGIVGAGGMDIGTMPSTADLSVYAIYNPASNTWNTLGCTGATSNGPVYGGAHMPAGYTASALIWAGNTTGSLFRAFAQQGRRVWMVPVLEFGGTTTNTTYTSLVLTGVPACATAVAGDLSMTCTANNTVRLASNAGGLARQDCGSTTPTYAVNMPYAPIPLVTAQTIYYLVDVVTGPPSVLIYVSMYDF